MHRNPLRRAAGARAAFTLLELVLVMVILGLLATVAALNLTSQADKARVDTTRTSMTVIEQALKSYYFEKGAYPTTEQGLRALVDTKHLEKMPLDGWKREFQYFSPGPNGAPYEIISLGKDAIAETEDDIRVSPTEKK